MIKKTFFKPAALTVALVSALFTMVPAQANAASVDMLGAIKIAEKMIEGNKAYSADLNGNLKRGYWEVEIVGPSGYAVDVRIKASTGQYLGREAEYDADFDDILERAKWYKDVNNGTKFSLAEAVGFGQETWYKSKAVEASFEPAETKDKWEDLEDKWDNWEDRNDDHDDDDDDRWEDRNEDRNGAKKAMYDITLKNGRREREVEIMADKKTPY